MPHGAAAMGWRGLLAAVLCVASGWCSAAAGLVGTYFANQTLTTPSTLVRVDLTVNFNWGSGSPDSSIPVDHFSARWTGLVRAAVTGSYSFQTSSDDGVRLYVNGTLVIGNWTDHSATTNTSAAITMTAGVDYPITLEYYENGGSAVMQLYWKKPADTAYSIIPASNGLLGLSTGVTPVLEYRFEEPVWAGTTGEVVDTSGSGLNGTAAGLAGVRPTTATGSPAVSGSPGTCGYGVFKRANKDYVALPAAFPNLGSTSGFTVTGWIKASDASAPGQRIFADDENGYAGTSAGGYLLSLGDAGTGKLSFASRATASAYTLSTAAVIANNTWYFVAFGIDLTSKTKSLYVYNTLGVQLAAVTATYTEASFGVDSGIASIGGETNAASGGENTASFGFGGNIDEVRVFPYVLATTDLDTVRTLTNTCPVVTPPVLVAEYHFEEGSWAGTAGELKDTAGYSGGPYNGAATGTPLPTVANASPAVTGTPGTCGYASLPGPQNNGGSFVVNGLPVSTTAGAQTSVAFWMYWNGTDGDIAIGWGNHDLWFKTGAFGFNTGNSDVYGISSSGLASGWHHVVAVFTNGSVTSDRLYIDGAVQAMSQRVGTPTLANAVVSSSLRIGGYGQGTGFRFSGRIDEVRVYTGPVTATEVTAQYTQTHVCTGVHHLEIRHATGTGLTCAPSTLTIAACQDAACTPYTGGVTGTLTATGSATTNWPSGAAFSIFAGSSTTTETLQVSTAGSVVLGTATPTPVPTNNTTCNFGSPSCTFTSADTGFVFDVPNHVADAVQTVTVSAVRKSDNAAVCVPAFASVSKSVSFSCAYQNPGSGTLPVRVGGSALNSANNTSSACDANGRAVSLAFNASGVASTTVQYADVGQLQLTARYVGSTGGEVGLVMTGTDTFIAAPATFAISGITAGPIKAGSNFAATVTARNSNAATTPNFGRETAAEAATLAFTRAKPTGSGASNGSFTGSLGAFTSGVASSSTLVWSEVGYGDVSATLASGSYLGSGLSATGTTGSAGAVGRFIPHHFDVAVTPACGSFSYAAQPFTVQITAKNGLATPTVTVNYNGNSATTPTYAQAVTLTDAPSLGVGSFGSTGAVAASAFSAGVATTSTPAYSYTNKLTAAKTLVVRATDADAVSSSGYAEGSTGLRSGRLHLSNAFGSEKAPLAMGLQAQYWSGSTWVPNTADNCSALPAGSVVQSAYYDNKGASSTAWSTSAGAVSFSAGNGTLTLAAPAPSAVTGSVDIALNLGGAAADQSCLAAHPASTGAALPWLRSQQGSQNGCAAAWDRDPAGRATFGIYAPETKKTLHVREVF